MIFLFHINFLLGLLVAGLGAGLVLWTYRNSEKGIRAAKIIGYIIAILAIASLLCTLYFGFKKAVKSECRGMRDCPRTMRMDRMELKRMLERHKRMQNKANRVDQRRAPKASPGSM